MSSIKGLAVRCIRINYESRVAKNKDINKTEINEEITPSNYGF